MWRIVFGFPLLLFSVQSLGFIFLCKYDGPAYYLSIRKRREAYLSFKYIYKTEDEDGTEFEAFCLEYEKSTKQTKSTKITLKEAFFTDETYVRASWINILDVIFHELVGINVIFQYSTTILDDIFGEDSEGFTAREGTYCITVFNFFASAASIWTINNIGRRRLLLVGHLAMTVIHAAIGTFIIIEFNAGVLLGICAFLVVYQNTSGPVSYTYATETCCDIALGMVILTLYAAILLLSLTTESMMNSALKSQGVFFLFAGVSLIAFVVIYFYLGETMGLSRAEKLGLYVPGGPWGRKLKPGEEFKSPMATPIKKTGYLDAPKRD